MPQALEKSGRMLAAGHRSLRDFSRGDPGISMPREAMRDLGLLEDGEVDTTQQVFVTVYDDGRVVIDLQVTGDE
ncbi:hypothetical protein RH831_08895 [Halodesulfurarchaeum sp. HSR-GB]|uniref:hypothetical protein n=1 Tax=Halodesulfurarchaeum sp. HSR-GB TaxID=3074077 RepID=UPI00285E78A5|nr:hypothetical protein [Halodesulfurarchaeum sp. HSR-GB]MDR5657296.1 hypothetical protein [Halodesulfurarchaeum sp. HSR-GB]